MVLKQFLESKSDPECKVRAHSELYCQVCVESTLLDPPGALYLQQNTLVRASDRRHLFYAKTTFIGGGSTQLFCPSYDINNFHIEKPY